MFATIPYKKMQKVNRFGFIAKCDCGHVHRFKGKDIDLTKSNGATAIFKNVYKCPKCGQAYDGIFENIADRNVWYKQLNPIGLLITLILILSVGYGGYKIYNVYTSENPPVNTDYNHATNKQIEDFNKWQQKQEQQKWEKSPAFPNK